MGRGKEEKAAWSGSQGQAQGPGPAGCSGVLPQAWALQSYFGFQKAIFAKIGLERKRLLFM